MDPRERDLELLRRRPDPRRAAGADPSAASSAARASRSRVAASARSCACCSARARLASIAARRSSTAAFMPCTDFTAAASRDPSSSRSAIASSARSSASSRACSAAASSPSITVSRASASAHAAAVRCRSTSNAADKRVAITDRCRLASERGVGRLFELGDSEGQALRWSRAAPRFRRPLPRAATRARLDRRSRSSSSVTRRWSVSTVARCAADSSPAAAIRDASRSRSAVASVTRASASSQARSASTRSPSTALSRASAAAEASAAFCRSDSSAAVSASRSVIASDARARDSLPDSSSSSMRCSSAVIAVRCAWSSVASARLRRLPGVRQLALQRSLRRRGLGGGGTLRGQSGFELGVRRRHFSGRGVLRAQIGSSCACRAAISAAACAAHPIGPAGVSCRQLRGARCAQIGLECGMPRRHLGGGGALGGQVGLERGAARTHAFQFPLQLGELTASRGLGVGRGLARRALALKLAGTLDAGLARLVQRGAEGLAFLLQPQPSRRVRLRARPVRARSRSAVPGRPFAPHRARAAANSADLLAGVDLIAQGTDGAVLCAGLCPECIGRAAVRVTLGSQCLGAGALGLERRLRFDHRHGSRLLRVQLGLEDGPRGRRLGFGRRHPRQIDDEAFERGPRIGICERGLERGQLHVELGTQGVELAPGRGDERRTVSIRRRTSRCGSA